MMQLRTPTLVVLLAFLQLTAQPAFTSATAEVRTQLLISQPSPLVLNVESTLSVNLTLTDSILGNFTCSIEDSTIANVSAVQASMARRNQTGGNSSFSVQLEGKKFGWSFLVCGSAKLQVTVLKPTGALDILYRVLLIVQVIGIVFCMGASVELQTVVKLVKRPVALCIGWVCQFVLMPHIGLAAGQLIKLALPNFISPNALAFGFLTFGCAPGGSGSNTYTYMLEGDLELSITQTFFANVCTFFMLPLWLFIYSRLYIDTSLVVIPFDQVAYTLLQSILPLAVGVLVRYKWPQVGKKITKAIAPLVILFILTVAGLGSFIYLYLLELLLKYPLVFPLAAMLPWSGFLLAYLVALACRLPRPQLTSVSVCGVQNAGIPIQLLLYSMPKPDGDIASIVPVAAAILTPIPVYIAVLAYRIRKRLRATTSQRKDSAQMYGSVELTDDGGGAISGGGGSEHGGGNRVGVKSDEADKPSSQRQTQLQQEQEKQQEKQLQKAEGSVTDRDLIIRPDTSREGNGDGALAGQDSRRNSLSTGV